MATPVLTPLGENHLPIHEAPPRRWSFRSLAILFLAWISLQLWGIFTPGLLDDVDSVYVEVAREMLQRHDFVTPFADGIRFFDKPPFMYWMAAASMKIFGVHDWSARLPLALLVLALLIAIYAIGIRVFASLTPQHPDRGGFYAALIMATSIGPYLFTRFFIPDILLALWMTLSVHLFLRILDEIAAHPGKSASRAACWTLAAVIALNVLTKGLIGLVFPVGVMLVYLAATRSLRLLARMRLLSSTGVFLAIAAPWHVLAALRNPAVGQARGWFWFYIINEHFMRFLGRRIPHDYGQVPLLWFWLLLAVWLFPWAAFLPAAIRDAVGVLRRKPEAIAAGDNAGGSKVDTRRTALLLAIWTLVVMGFFSLSSRQEYYSLPAVPALALLVGGLLAREDADPETDLQSNPDAGPFMNVFPAATVAARRSVLLANLWLVLPISLLISGVCAWFAWHSSTPPPGADIFSLLDPHPEAYTLSLGHLFDLTGKAMGLFRAPLAGVSVAMLLGGLGSFLLRWRRCYFAANLALAAAMGATLACAHEGLRIFYPTLGSKPLALAINQSLRPGDLILLDGEYTSGSGINFYTRQQVRLVDGRVNGMWYGSFWPDAPSIFETDASLDQLWTGRHRVFLVTANPRRAAALEHFGAVFVYAESGGKTILTNHAR